MRSGRFLPPILQGIEQYLHGLSAVENPSLGAVPPGSGPADKTQILNRAWRRSDWRFLTLHPWPRCSLCYGDESLARALALISGSLAVNRPAPEGSCDLAALQAPTDGTLFMAMQALAPSGVLYAEFSGPVYQRGPRRVANARRMLEAAGFVDIQFFCPYPTVETAWMWLPADQPDASCRYLAARQYPRSPMLQRAAARLLTNAVRLDLLPGLCAIARKPSGQPISSGLASLHGDILDLGRDIFDSLARISSGQYALLLQSTRPSGSGAEDSGAPVRSPITGLVFTPQDIEPGWLLKLARVHEDEAALRSEQQVLERLERITSGDSSPVRLPRVLFLRETNPGVVLCETATPGQPLSEVLSSANFSLYAERLTNLQISLARRTLATSPLGMSQARIEALINELAGCLPQEVLRLGEIARLRQIFSTLDNLPMVCAHNHFAPWNVRLDGSRLGLLNWADAEWSGLPMLDLVYMLAQMTFLLHVPAPARSVSPTALTERAAAAYRAMLDPLTRPGQIAQECLFRYTHSLGLPSGLVPALRLLTWTQQAVLETRRLRQLQGQAVVGQLAGSQSLALLRVELQEQVLPAWDGD